MRFLSQRRFAMPAGTAGRLLGWACVLGACASAAQQAAPADHAARDREAITSYVQEQQAVRSISTVALSPDGRQIAWSAAEGGANRVFVTAFGPAEKTVPVSAATEKPCYEGEPRWSPAGNEVAFLSDCAAPGQLDVYVTRIAGGDASKPERLTHAEGALSHLGWSPDGSHLSVLYVRHASRAPGPMSAEARAIGVIDERVNHEIERVAVVRRSEGDLREVTPPDLYAYEYDWSPDGRELAFTAAAPPGDDNWYVAQLYRQRLEEPQAHLVYHPKEQIALPRWSPDGLEIGFIEGLMSDEGGTGGEIYVVAATGAERARNLTPNSTVTPAWFCWRPDNSLLLTEFVGGSTAIATLDPRTGETKTLWQGDRSLHASNEETSLSVAQQPGSAGKGAALRVAMVQYGWSALPEIWAGTPEHLEQVTHLNAGSRLPLPRSENVTWQSDGRTVQGWLLYPAGYDPAKRYPLLVAVHGGPAWITTPMWSAPDFNTTVYPQFGYFVLFPNPRGSYGAGEAFTAANRRDWGFGDLQDTLRGVDAVVARQPIDPQRIGLLGWSYGGSTAMFAGTQTHRFRALVAGAGAADWLSYYGQNSIDQWMQPYFHASPYDDPEAYARVSAMTHIRATRTPTLVLVGERDGEAPPAQSFQFWHALKELRVPTQLVVYADEGHDFWKPEDRVDVTLRTLEWFRQYMPETKQPR